MTLCGRLQRDRSEVMKNVLKTILSKILVFLFCVVFVSSYNAIFGSENSLVGITLLTTLLVFLGKDMGYKTWQGAICIPALLLVAGIGPKLASFNVYLGFFINFLSIMLILICSSYYLDKDNHVPFLLGYVFCEGAPAAGAVFGTRLMSFAIIGGLIGGIYYLIHGKKQYELSLKEIVGSIHLKEYRIQWYIKMAFGLSLAMFLGQLFHYPKSLWINCAVLSLTHHHPEERAQRMKYRLPATLLGSGIFIILLLVVPAQYQTLMTIGIGFGIMFLEAYQNKTMGNSVSALFSSLAMFSSVGAVILRILSNVIGLGLAYINHKVFDRLFEKHFIESAEA